MSFPTLNHKVKTCFRSEENLYVSSKVQQKERSEMIMCSNRKSKLGMQYLEVPSKSTSSLNQRSPKRSKKLFEHTEAHKDNKTNHKHKTLSFDNNDVHRDNKNIHKLKNIGLNMKDFVILTYNRVRKDSLKLSHKNNNDTDDLNIFGIEEIIDRRPVNAYMGRRFTREIIRYKRLAVIEEGDESVFDGNLGLHHFYKAFEEHRNSKAELEIILQHINKIKEKMIPNFHPEGSMSTHDFLHPKKSPRRFHYERKGFLEIRTKLT